MSPATCRPSCDKGDAHACAVLGDQYARLPDAQDNPTWLAIGAKYLDEACAKHDAEACEHLATVLILLQVDDRSITDKRIADARKRACDNHSIHCGNPDQATLEKRCAAGQPYACRWAANALGPDPSAPVGDDDPPPPPPEDDPDDESGGTGTAMALDEGKMGRKPLKPDPKKAKQLRARGVKLVADACAAKKLRICADNDESPASLELACKAGVAEDCYELAQRNGDGTKWIEPAKRGCALGDFTLCSWLASGAESGEHGMAKDAAQATAFYTKGCDAHDGVACTMLAKAEKDPAKQLVMYQRACGEDELYACEQAGDALWKTDAKAALVLHQKSCDMEQKIAALERPICSELGARFDAGTGVAKDPVKAKALRAQGCKAGEKKGC